MVTEAKIEGIIESLRDIEVGLQLRLGQMEKQLSNDRQYKMSVTQDLMRMNGIVDNYREAGVLHLLGRDFPTAQSISDQLVNMRYEELFNIAPRRRNNLQNVFPYTPVRKAIILFEKEFNKTKLKPELNLEKKK